MWRSYSFCFRLQKVPSCECAVFLSTSPILMNNLVIAHLFGITKITKVNNLPQESPYVFAGVYLVKIARSGIAAQRIKYL